MSLKATHDLHRRRFGRNLGVGLALGAFILLVFGLTVVKMPRTDLTGQGAPAATGAAD